MHFIQDLYVNKILIRLLTNKAVLSVGSLKFFSRSKGVKKWPYTPIS